MQGRLTSQEVLQSALDCLGGLAVPQLQTSTIAAIKADLAELKQVMIDGKKSNETELLALVDQLRKNILSYLSPQYDLWLLYDGEEFDEKAARPEKLYLKRQPNGKFQYTVKTPNDLFVSYTLTNITIPECKQDNQTKLTKEEVTQKLNRNYKAQILTTAYEQNHLLSKPSYPSSNYNALHNVLLLLGVYFPHPSSLSGKALQCVIHFEELTLATNYFMTEEGIYYLDKVFNVDDGEKKCIMDNENKYKNPTTNRTLTSRDQDRIKYFVFQNEFPNANPGFLQRFGVSFSKRDAKKGIVFALRLLTLAMYVDLVMFNGAILFSIIPAGIMSFLDALLIHHFYLSCLAFSLTVSVPLMVGAALIGALIGGLKIYYSSYNTTSDLKNRIGDLPNFRNPAGYMGAGRYTLFSHDESKLAVASQPAQLPPSPRASHSHAIVVD